MYHVSYVPTHMYYIYDLDPIKTRFTRTCREERQDAAGRMPKLDTYVRVKDFAETGTLVKANLNRAHRSLMAHLLCGILPLEVETRRFSHNKVDRELRHCRVCATICKKPETEDEIHFIFKCDRLKNVRDARLKPILDAAPETKDYNNFEKLKWLLDSDRIMETGSIVAALFKRRQDFLYKENKEKK